MYLVQPIPGNNSKVPLLTKLGGPVPRTIQELPPLVLPIASAEVRMKVPSLVTVPLVASLMSAFPVPVAETVWPFGVVPVKLAPL